MERFINNKFCLPYMENNDLKDIWELYGVKENPFSTSPILVKGGSIPLTSFVGRGEYIKRLSRTIGSKGGSRTFVYGDIGIGKTSFVNMVRSSAFDNGFFTHFKEITTQDKWTPDDFVLNSLSAIYSTFKLMKNKPISDETYNKMNSLFDVGKQATMPSSFTLQNFFADLVAEINKKTGKEVIMHYNNLELVREKNIRRIFDNLRDFFQTEGVHFVFIGNLTAYSILQSIPRFSSNLSDTPFHIEKLTYKEVKEIIKLRFESLRISDDLNLIYPFNDDCLEILYKLMEGNIRDILNSLSTAVFYATSESPVVLDRNRLAITLKEVLEKRYLNRLTPRALDVLKEIAEHYEITNKSLSDKLKIPRSNISAYIRDLETNGCVFLRRKNGKDKFWKADPKIKWSLLKESAQQTLKNF